jgi:mRNA interferase RelE/StbE
LKRSPSGSAWRVSFSPAAERALVKLDRNAQSDILRYLNSRVATAEDPRRSGKPLKGPLAGLWRYRVRDFRIICQIKDADITVLVLDIGDRKEVYR